MSNLDSLVDDFYGSNKPAAAKPAAQAGAAGIDANDNVRRFLDFLGQAEGADYDVIVGGSRFDDFSRHPNIVGLRTAEGPSTAAGKYQITGTTYRDFAPRLGINDFSPESQVSSCAGDQSRAKAHSKTCRRATSMRPSRSSADAGRVCRVVRTRSPSAIRRSSIASWGRDSRRPLVVALKRLPIPS